MNWQPTKHRQLVSDAGYRVDQTAIAGRALHCATAPNNEILGVPGTRAAAIQLCESHYRQKEPGHAPNT